MSCSLQGSSAHEILQQEYWSGLPFRSPGDLPDPGSEPGSPALQADYLLSYEGSPFSRGSTHAGKKKKKDLILSVPTQFLESGRDECVRVTDTIYSTYFIPTFSE